MLLLQGMSTATKKTGRYVGNCVKILDISGVKSTLNQIKVMLE
ncbi:hypothetical protein M8C21_025564 [Ambrosia artemisiifolia]|uniref:Uncharacterized protein n=1 Tax=Ambrosia artemisiifolia TaxID=4212 RepID=A0AAD5GDT3_AMBAR|nr:hypothetical protein M8C21_025564 [Ambrosia artemisiifolia]